MSYRSKILIFAPGAELVGGVQTWLDYLASGLESHGWSVGVRVSGGRASNGLAYLRAHPFRDGGVVENPTGSEEGRRRALLAQMRQFRPDIVLGVNIIDVYAAVNMMRQSGDRKVRCAMAVHAISPCVVADVRRHRAMLDGVISANRLTKIVIGQVLPDVQAYYAPVGVRVESDGGVSSTEERRLSLLYVGRISAQEKGVFDLARIARKLAETGYPFQMTIIGDGPDRSELERQMASHGNVVRFMGMLPHSEVMAECRVGRILLITSPTESGPLALWDAMGRGVAAVSSDYVGSGAENALVDGTNCLQFPCGDVDYAVRQIVRLADRQLLERIGRAGARTVRERYSLHESLKAWHEALTRIMEAPARPGVETASTAPRGRLDRWLGVSRAEGVRRFVGLTFRHATGGSEWPHTCSNEDEGPVSMAVFREIDRKCAQERASA